MREAVAARSLSERAAAADADSHTPAGASDDGRRNLAPLARSETAAATPVATGVEGGAQDDDARADARAAALASDDPSPVPTAAEEDEPAPPGRAEPFAERVRGVSSKDLERLLHKAQPEGPVSSSAHARPEAAPAARTTSSDAGQPSPAANQPAAPELSSAVAGSDRAGGEARDDSLPRKPSDGPARAATAAARPLARHAGDRPSENSAEPAGRPLSTHDHAPGGSPTVGVAGASSVGGAPGPAAGAQPAARRTAESPEATGLTATVSRGLAAAVSQKGGSITLRLEPDSLGALRIQLDITGGVVRATFEATTAQAAEALSRSIESLRASLESKGLSVESIRVEHAPGAPAAPPQQGAGTNNGPEHRPGWSGQGSDGQRGFGHDAGDGRSRGHQDRQAGGGDHSRGQTSGEDTGSTFEAPVFERWLRLGLDTRA